jgi:hypothetical protein
LAARTGWGWAVGGVPGNGPIAQFVSIAEARAFGVAASTLSTLTGAPQILLDVTPSSVLLPTGSPFTLIVPLVEGSSPLSYQWQYNGANLSDDARITGSHSASLSLTAAATGDSGGYRLIVTNTLGATTSVVAQVTVTPSITFNGNGAGWTLNTITTNAPIVNNVLTLTDGGLSEARSCFLNNPVSITSFNASYTYQDIGGQGADGAAFVFQNSTMGPAAIGGAGGGLAYAGIAPSAALEMDIYAGSTPGIAFRVNGATGGPYSSTAPVSLPSGHPINFAVSYDGTTAVLTMTDTLAGTSFSTNYTANLPSLVGGNTAYVGFTGASGGVASFEQISNFVFANQAITQPAISAKGLGGNLVLLSWPGSATGFGLLQSSNLVNWSQAPEQVNLTNGQFQASVTASNSHLFYRLQHQ